MTEVFRGGHVHVLAEKCATCIFRSVNDGRIKGLHPGRVGEMVVGARANDSCIPCHSTLYDGSVQPAICRGFWDLPNPTQTIQLAQRLPGVAVYDPPPRKEPSHVPGRSRRGDVHRRGS